MTKSSKLVRKPFKMSWVKAYLGQGERGSGLRTWRPGCLALFFLQDALSSPCSDMIMMVSQTNLVTICYQLLEEYFVTRSF